ncbi:CLUMA_CG021286, isoform A [Clunio marinus]|uniref:CLUMA_CG021286, isoform A n=1 Tax=Clunio marinus TaxID=568069 RepID=A0A1J1J7L0_9DIPT|nr:CLUMA_CG021286, isoform A [Clunio marinus]
MKSLVFCLLLVIGVQGIELICNYITVDWKDGAYICDAVNFTATKRYLEVDSLHGEHIENKTNFDVTAIRIDSQTAEYMPWGFDKFFPNMTDYAIIESKLEKIQRSDLENLTFLKVLSLNDNEINQLLADTFDDMTNLEYLSLSKNKIKELPDNVFRALTNLQGLYIDSNELSEISFKVLENNTMLKELALNNNQLEYINSEIFGHLVNLEYVNLSSNKCIGIFITSIKHFGSARIKEILKLNCNNVEKKFEQCKEDYEKLRFHYNLLLLEEKNRKYKSDAG